MRNKAIVLITTLGLIVSACSNGDDTKSTTKPNPANATVGAGLFRTADLNKAQHAGTPERGGSITFGMEADILDVSPAKGIVQPSDRTLAAAVFDPLVSFGDHDEPVVENADHHANQLADQVTHPDGDLATWTVHLRPGVTFSNGKPLDAAQVVSHTNWVKAGGQCACKTDADEITELESGTDPQGRETVTYHLSDPVVDWPAKIAETGLGWITESGARGTDTVADVATDKLIGTGPFRFAARDGDTYKVVKNPTYYGVDPLNGQKLPYLDEIDFRPLADSTTRLQALQSGAVQIMQTADTSNLVNAAEDSRLVIQPIQGSSSTIQILNLTHPPFGVEPEPGETPQQTAQRSLSDPLARKAREAFQLSINRNEINQKYYRGTRVPAYGLIPSTSPYFSTTGQLGRYNPKRAKALIGELTRAGVDMSLRSMCVNTPEASGVHQIMSQQQQAVGFDSKQTQVDQAKLVQMVMGGTDSADWDVSCFRSGQFSDPDGLYPRLHTGGSLNLVKYSRSDVDGWLEQARRTADVAVRKADYDKVQRKVAADIVYVPLLYDLFGNVHVKQLSGLSRSNPNALGSIRPGSLYYLQ